MTQELWTNVDRYLCDRFIGPDPIGTAVLEASAAGGLPGIQVSPTQGKLLNLLAQMCSATRILEIGTLGGYSTIWLGRALGPKGRVITLEADPKHAEVARANFARAGLADRIELRLGKALDTLPGLVSEAPFDLIFIDADKVNIPAYFSWSLKLARPGSVIVVDNVIREGRVLDAASQDASIQGVRQFNEQLSAEKRVQATTIQTVGSKGYDGLAIVLVKPAG